MKKVLVLFLFMFIIAFASLAEDLSIWSQLLKKEFPTSYTIIQHHAIERYGRGNSMTISQINKQVIAIYMCIEFSNNLQDKASSLEYLKALRKASYIGYKIDKNTPQMELHIDWHKACLYLGFKQEELQKIYKASFTSGRN